MAVFRRSKTIIAIIFGFGLSGCSTVKLPKLDLLKLPEFKEESENIGAYPNVVDAPGLPSDVRSAGDWDNTAKAIIKARDSINTPPESGGVKSPAEIEQEIARLKAKVNEYRADDPQ